MDNVVGVVVHLGEYSSSSFQILTGDFIQILSSFTTSLHHLELVTAWETRVYGALLRFFRKQSGKLQTHL